MDNSCSFSVGRRANTWNQSRNTRTDISSKNYKNTPFPVPPTTTPANAKAIKIEVTAEDDWKIAVTAIPINKSKNGLSIEDNKSLI